MKKVLYVLSPLPLILCGLAWAATVRTVDQGGGGDFKSIQFAIYSSASGDEVHVAAGTYSEQITMKDGVNLLGGYSASGWSRDPETNVTVIDGGGSGRTVTAANATVDGFTIKGSGRTNFAAGIYVLGASPTISGNKITGNGGYGVYVEGNSSPLIQKNVFSNNSSYALYCYSFGNGGTPEVYNNTFDGNRQGVRLYAFSPVIRNNIITGSREYGISCNVNSAPSEDYDDLWSNASGNCQGISAGPHDRSSDPLYAGGGYALQTAPVPSPCIDAGTYVGLAYAGLPDMGAYESSFIRTAIPPPAGLLATPRNTMVRVDWAPNAEPQVKGYKVSYGNVPGSYTQTADVGNVTEYDARGLINDASYFFAVRAYANATSISDYSLEVGATPTAGSPELPHYYWDASFRGGDCAACHYRNTGAGELLPADYDYRYSSELCISCHNVTGNGRGKAVKVSDSHPVFVNATTKGDNIPTYGNITGMWSNRMGDHLKPGNIIVCNTCHNAMEKTEDPGRTWELAADPTGGHWDFYMQRGGWSWYGYMRPAVYWDASLFSAPTYIRERGKYKLDPSLYSYDIGAGKITYNAQRQEYTYVTLGYPYLRVDNTENVMCLDCHNIGTHQLENCLTCHESHNYTNLHGIRPVIHTPNSGDKSVVFMAYSGVYSFADGYSVFDGVCEVCHTKTRYYRNDGGGSVLHSDGENYDGMNCVSCHTHESGFSK